MNRALGLEGSTKYWRAPAPGNPASELAPLPADFEKALARVETDRWRLFEWDPMLLRAKLEPPPVESSPEDR